MPLSHLESSTSNSV